MKRAHYFGCILILAIGNHLAGAQRVSISGTGTITYSTLAGTAINDPIAISVSYNPAVSPSASGGVTATFGSVTELSLSIQFNGHNWQAQMSPGPTVDNEPVQLQNNSPGPAILGASGGGDAMTFVGLPAFSGNILTINPLAFPNDGGFFLLSLNDTGSPYDLIQNLSLPNVGNVPDFGAMTVADGVFRVGGSSPFEIRYQLDPASVSLAMVPEPSVGALSLAGVAVYCAGFRRRFARYNAQSPVV